MRASPDSTQPALLLVSERAEAREGGSDPKGGDRRGGKGGGEEREKRKSDRMSVDCSRLRPESDRY